MDELDFNRYLQIIGELVKIMNQYVDGEKPWVLAKSDDANLPAVLYRLLEGLRQVGTMLYPCLPQTSSRILAQLGLVPIDEHNFNFSTAQKWGGMVASGTIHKTEVLFPKSESSQ